MGYNRFNKLVADAEVVKALIADGIPSQYASAMASRGINSDNYQLYFGDPEQLVHNPLDMLNMSECIDTINQIIEMEGSVLICGDYDADGLTASSILSTYFSSIGINHRILVPERSQGYGINVQSVLSAFEEDWYDLIITVDCGISNVKEIDELNAYFDGSVEIIVTDHHELPAVLPNCLCLNPKLGYPFKHLAGAGVAYKLVSALSGRSDIGLELAVIGTIADVMPLVDENRAIVKKGLDSFNHKGILKLAEVSKCSKKLTATDIAMRIAPKINAAGRVDSPSIALPLLLSEKKADIITANKLLAINEKRRQLTDSVYSEALNMHLASQHGNIVFVYSDSWQHGILGIVASRLCEMFGVVSVVMTRDGDNYVGSMRGTASNNVVEVLTACSDILVKFGGHAASAGFSVSADNLFELGDRLSELCVSTSSKPCIEYDIEYDGSTPIKQYLQFDDMMQPMQPSDSLMYHTISTVQHANIFGKQSNHVSIKLTNGLDVKAFFDYVPYIKALQSGAEVEIVFTLSHDDYSGGYSAIVKHFCINNSLHLEGLFATNYINGVNLSGDVEFNDISSLSDLASCNHLILVDSTAQLEKLAKTIDISDYQVDYFHRNTTYGKGIVVSLQQNELLGQFDNVTAFVSSREIPRYYGEGVAHILLEEGSIFSGVNLDRDICVKVYGAIRNMSDFDTIEELCIKYLTGKVTETQYYASIRVFEQLGVVKNVNGRLVTNSSIKVNLDDSAIYRQLSK